LGIYAVLDRLIQQTVAQVLSPMFDPDFSEFSFGLRPGKSARGAVNQLREYIRQGYRTAALSIPDPDEVIKFGQTRTIRG